MLYMLRNKKGITSVEAIVAIFIATVAIGSMAARQPVAMRTGASSDYLGRAVAIAQAEAVRREAVIMTTGAALLPDDPITRTVQNVTYSITTVTTPPVAPQNFWLVSVRVTWPGTASGITHNT